MMRIGKWAVVLLLLAGCVMGSVGCENAIERGVSAGWQAGVNSALSNFVTTMINTYITTPLSRLPIP